MGNFLNVKLLVATNGNIYKGTVSLYIFKSFRFLIIGYFPLFVKMGESFFVIIPALYGLYV